MMLVFKTSSLSKHGFCNDVGSRSNSQDFGAADKRTSRIQSFDIGLKSPDAYFQTPDQRIVGFCVAGIRHMAP